MQRLFGRFAFFAIIFLYSMIGYSQVLITSTGTLNNFVVNYPANITVLQSGMEITFFSNQTITNSPSLNVNTTGLRPIYKNVNQSLSNGEIKAGQAVTVVFDGTNWQLMSTVSPSTATGFWSTLGNVSDSTANYIGTINNQPLTFYTSGTERMRISRAGRFGFNMNPTAASMFNIKSIGNGAILTVNRSTDSGALIELTETGGGNARIDMYNSLNANVVQIPSGGGNIFFAGGGNLGINTTAPGNTLHVAGGARIGNLTSAGLVYANNNGDLYINTATGINIWTITGTYITPQIRTNNLALGPDGYGFPVLGDNSVMLAYDGGEVFYETNSGDASEGLLMQSGGSNSGIIKNLSAGAGSYMIGKPNNALFIFNRAAEPIHLETNNITRMSIGATGIVGIKNLTSAGSYFVQANSLGDLFISTNTGQSPFWALGGNSVSGVRTLGTTNNFDLQIITNNEERLRILQNGYVRLGNITTASAGGPGRFIVSYDAQNTIMHMVSASTASSDAFVLGGITFSDSQQPTFYQASIIAQRDGVSSGPSDLPTRIAFSTMADGTSTNVERMRISSNGNVGIRTTSPIATLDLRALGSTTGNALRLLDSGGATSFNVLDNGATGIGTTAISGYQLYLQTATADPNYRSLVISNDYSGATDKYGIYNSVTGNGSGSKFAIYNLLTGLAGDASVIYGEFTNMDPFGSGTTYGNRIRLNLLGTGIRYGMYSEVYGAASNNSPIYGVLGYVNHTGTSTGAASYSFYGQNASTGAGNQYGIYTISEQYNYHAGSLGLGILVPTEKLDVSGSTEVTGDYKYASPKVRYKSLSPASFTVESNLYYLNHVGSYAYVAGGALGSTAALYANLDLPDNSTITGLYFYYVDNNVTYGIGPAYIYEVQSNTGVTPNFTTSFNTTASTAAASSTTITLQSNLSDTPLLIDNDTKSYMVVLSTIQNTSTLRIVRCRVRYIVPNAD